MSDAFLYRAAHTLIAEYGDEALPIATKRAQALAYQDDIDGAAVWLGVVCAIKAMRSATPEGQMH